MSCHGCTLPSWWTPEARIVWEHDGIELVRTVATTYTTRLVLVRLADDRWPTLGVWLPPEDVRRV